MAKEKKAKLKEIRIKLHHSPDGESDGFSVEHHHVSRNDLYDPPEDHGAFRHHGELMEHIHEHVKDHGEQQDELSGGKREDDGESGEEETACVLCSNPGEKDAAKEEKHPNITRHGYEKHSVNSPHRDAKHPGFKAVEKKIEAKEGLSHKAAGAILAARSRGASASAHKANPRLNRVKG